MSRQIKHKDIVEDQIAWRDKAACIGRDLDLFFPGRWSTPRDIKTAKRVCERCPSQAECLNYALTNNLTEGIWGGKTEHERRKIRREQKARA